MFGNDAVFNLGTKDSYPSASEHGRARDAVHTNAFSWFSLQRFHPMQTTHEIKEARSSSHPTIKAQCNEKKRKPVRHPSPPTLTARPKADHSSGQDHHHSLYSPPLSQGRPPRLRAVREYKVSLLGSEEISHQPGWNLWLV